MKHAFVLTFRLLLLIVALYAISNALKELLLREDDPIQATLLVLFNVVIAAVCWSLGCWSSQRSGRRAPIARGDH
jgi:predicted Co/Zn/Cd cation transporter (cation efflux family)